MLTTVLLYRLDRGLSRSEVVRRSGIPARRYRDIEEGRDFPSAPDELDDLARALGVSFDRLVDARRLVVDVVPPRTAIAGPYRNPKTGAVDDPTPQQMEPGRGGRRRRRDVPITGAKAR